MIQAMTMWPFARQIPTLNQTMIWFLYQITLTASSNEEQLELKEIGMLLTSTVAWICVRDSFV